MNSSLGPDPIKKFSAAYISNKLLYVRQIPPIRIALKSLVAIFNQLLGCTKRQSIVATFKHYVTHLTIPRNKADLAGDP